MPTSVRTAVAASAVALLAACGAPGPAVPAAPPSVPSAPATSVPGTAAQYPGQILDLRDWYLTLPTGTPEDPDTVHQPELETYSGPYFRIDDAGTGVLFPLTIVTDNGPAYKSTDFLRFVASRPELDHVRTRHHAPETNGVVERFNGSIKYEHLYRLEIADGLELADEAEVYRRLYNEVRPHEALDFATPLSRYLAHPGSHLSEPESVQDS